MTESIFIMMTYGHVKTCLDQWQMFTQKLPSPINHNKGNWCVTICEITLQVIVVVAVTQVFTYDLLLNHYNGCRWLMALEWQMVKDDSLDHDQWHWMTHIHWTMTTGTGWLIIQLNYISFAVCVTFSTCWIIHKFYHQNIAHTKSVTCGWPHFCSLSLSTLNQFDCIFHFCIMQYIL